MTDGWLMEADCIHGVAWYECQACGDELDAALNAIEEGDISHEVWDP
jgi:hypothetical protein